MNEVIELIPEKCQELEKEKNIKILFCVESGSRVWRMSSKDSDYDCRFVFVRPVEDYIAINKSDDVITAAYDEEGNRMSQEGCYYDFCGFDIFKFVKMLWSSNPTVIEWLMSDVVYYGNQNKVFKEFAEKQFKPISLYYHYKSMCKQNYLKYLKDGKLVTYKKYLYAMRGLVNAEIVRCLNQVPPINFERGVWIMGQEHFTGKSPIPQDILDKILDMIVLKRKGQEKDIIQNQVKIDTFIESFLKDDKAPTTKKLNTDRELNEELRKIVLG